MGDLKSVWAFEGAAGALKRPETLKMTSDYQWSFQNQNIIINMVILKSPRRPLRTSDSSSGEDSQKTETDVEPDSESGQSDVESDSDSGSTRTISDYRYVERQVIYGGDNSTVVELPRDARTI